MNKKAKVVTDLRIVEYDNPPIVRGRYEFDYAPHNSRGLKRLRDEYGLDKVIAKGKTEFEQLLLLRDWASRRWDHGFCNLEKWSRTGLDYLRRAEKGECFTCAVFASMLVEAATALGFPARNLTIAKADTDFIPRDTDNIGHCVAEVWSNQFRKWLVLDADTASHYERDGAPLNALEIRQAWLDGTWKKVRFVRGKHIPRIRPTGYPGTVEQLRRGTKVYFKHNIMDYYHNLEFHLGNHHYARAGFHPRRLVWADERRLPQIVRQNVAVNPRERIITTYRSDVYYTLNHAFIRVHCPPRRDHRPVPMLNVDLETETPWFGFFQVRVDCKTWRKGPARSVWKLHDGANVIEARPVNKFGRQGIITRLVVGCKINV